MVPHGGIVTAQQAQQFALVNARQIHITLAKGTARIAFVATLTTSVALWLGSVIPSAVGWRMGGLGQRGTA
ncbi:hypothetical protein HAALTHF_38960n [Vreelandella aquamarina]|nr:hypothetical protein HAALTHF_38960n [Halomonas axialensis]